LPRNLFLFKIIDQLELWTCPDLEYHVKSLGGMLEREKKTYARLWDIPKDYDPYWYFRKYYRERLPLLTRLQYLDFHTYLPSDILTKIDRTSMAVSLEARVPLLSKEIIEYSFSLPESVRYYKGQLKGLLKETYKDVLPPEILTRPKKGFSIPKYYLRKDNGFKQEQILKEVFHLA
jgi:asparagine synthase (glutamine-hydrolysing)